MKTKEKIFDSLLSIYFLVVRTTDLDSQWHEIVSYFRDYINKLDPTVNKAGRSDATVNLLETTLR